MAGALLSRLEPSLCPVCFFECRSIVKKKRSPSPSPFIFTVAVTSIVSHRHRRHHAHVHLQRSPLTFLYTKCTPYNNIQLKATTSNKRTCLRDESGCPGRSARTPHRRETYGQPRALHTFPTNLSCTFTQQWGVAEVMFPCRRGLR